VAEVEEYQQATVRLQVVAVDSAAAAAADSAVGVAVVDLLRPTEHPVEVAAAGHRPPATEHPRLRATGHPRLRVTGHPHLRVTGHLHLQAMGHHPAAAAEAVSEVAASAAEHLPVAMEHLALAAAEAVSAVGHYPPVMEPHLAPPAVTEHHL